MIFDSDSEKQKCYKKKIQLWEQLEECEWNLNLE